MARFPEMAPGSHSRQRWRFSANVPASQSSHLEALLPDTVPRAQVVHRMDRTPE
jgi:hypothetical protein